MTGATHGKHPVNSHIGTGGCESSVVSQESSFKDTHQGRV